MKTSLFIFIALFSSLLVSLHQCGHIYSQPTEIIPQNALAATQFQFFFMVETSLAIGDCLFIKFPMLVTTATASISATMDPTALATISTTPYTQDASTGVDTRFFQLSQALAANTWSRVQVNISSASTQSVGVQGCVWFATTSDYHSNYITYDENRCFDVLSFAPTIDTSGSYFKVTGYYLFAATSTYKTFGGTYGVNFDITPSQMVGLPGAVFTITLPGLFTFSGTCTSIACTSNDGSAGDYCISTNLTALSSYTCTYVSNVLTLNMTQLVSLNTSRINVNIQNPSKYISSAVAPTATFQSAKAPIIFATSTVSVGGVNGINLVTDFTTISLSGATTLMWGAVPSSATTFAARSYGYTGCPIVLYASNGIKVFNSLKTSFTLTSAITAMTKNSNIQATWTLMFSSLLLVDSLIYNSLYTSMPGPISFAFTAASNLVTISGITSLSATTYTIGGKFSIDLFSSVNGLANLVVLSTATSPLTPTCGAVVISTGDGAKTYYQVTGTTIGVKKNMDYYDATILATSNGALKLYNQLFSYWSTASQYAFSTTTAAATTFTDYMLGKAGSSPTTAATAGVWAKPSSATNTQALLIQLYFLQASVCVGISTNYLGGYSLLSDCASATFVPQIAVLLKIVFNNGLLNIPTASFLYGVQIIGTLFPSAPAVSGSSIIGVMSYSSTGTTTSVIGNIIIADTTNNLWHVSVSCIPAAAPGTPGDITCFSATDYSSTTVSGISFINTAITKYPSLYPDIYVLDFIVCIKIALYSVVVIVATPPTLATPTPLETASTAATGWQLVEEGCIAATTVALCAPKAGPGLINGYVLSGSVDAGTVKTSIVNGYLKTTATAASGYASTVVNPFIPAYLRLGMTISSPVASASMVGFFVGGVEISTTSTLWLGLSTYAAAATSAVNIIDTVGSVTSAIVGQGQSAGFDPSTTDLWWAQNSILLSTSVSSGTSTTFNYYVPLQISFSTIASLNVAFLSSQSNGQYPVNAVYRVFGGIFSNGIVSATDFTTIGAVYYHSVGTVATANLDSYTITISNSELSVLTTFWDNDLPAAATGCFGSTTTTTIPKMTTSSGSILPSATLTGFYIASAVANAVSATATTCLISKGNQGASVPASSLTALVNWGSAFIVYVRESTNVFASSTLTWGYANSGTNKCVPQTIIYNKAGTVSNIFTIFCTTDYYSGATFGSSTGTIAFTSFVVPFFWALNYGILSKVNYAWSDTNGAITTFNGDPATVSSWTYKTGCVASDSLSLAASSYDVPITITLTSSNGVTFNLAAADTLELTVGGSQASSFYTGCTHSTLSCSSSGGTTPTITLTNSGTTSLSISDSSIIVYGWVDTGATGTATVYSVIITYNGGDDIETCNSLSTGGLQVSGTALVNVVTISSWNYMANEGARGVWSFTFNYPRIIRSGYEISLNVGPLAGPTSSSNNYRCMILQSGGSVSNSWSLLTAISPSYVSMVTSKTLFSSGGSFIYKCLGGNSPDASVGFTNLMTGSVLRSGGTTITATSIPAANQYTVPTPSSAAPSLSGVTLTKFFNTRGFNSDYVINFIPSAANITTSGRIVVEFSQSISPKLNKYGRPECYLNETPAFCQFPTGDERRVLVWPTMNLLTTNTYPYVLKIASVTQPNAFSSTDVDTNKKIFFALSPTSNPYASISEYTSLTETWDSSASTSTIASILIQDFSFSSSKFRSSSSFTYVLNFPANSFTTAGSILWVQFPGSLAQSLFYGSSLSFSFIRVYDSTSTNIVSRYSILRGTRVAVFMNADSVNSASCNYTLTINGVYSPMNPSSTGVIRDDFTIFTSTDNITVSASTASGSRNTTTYISWNTGSYASSKILLWYDALFNQLMLPVQVTLGTYNALVFLSASLNTFTNTFNFSVNGGNSSAILTVPKNPAYPIRAVLGSTAAPVYLAAVTGSVQGIYFLQWSSTDTSGYTPVPNLDIIVVASNCTPILPVTSFNVPFGGGTSDPIIIDFSQCIPATDVTVTANVTSGYNLSSSVGISLSGAQTATSSLTFTNMNGNYKVAFYAVSNSGSTGTNTAGAATISFTMSGTNGADISTPGTVTINLVQAITTAPNPMTPTISSASVLGVGCDQTGTNYFALATFTNAASYNITYINSVTQFVKVPLTTPAQTDPYYTVLGYVSGLTISTYSSVSLAGYLKAGANLTVYSYCMSNSLVPSTNASSLNWLQPDNGGKTVVLQASFYAPLTSSQKLELTCAIVKSLVISSRLVQDDQGQWCTSLRVLQNTTSTSNSTTNSTTTTTTTNNTTTNTTYPAYFYILKNYLAATDNTSTLVASSIASSTYLSSLISTTSDSSFPTPSSNWFNATYISTSNNNSTTVPVVNYISAVTSTTSINATFNLTNINGVVYAGVEPNVANATSTPNVSNLIQGYDGYNIQLASFGFAVASAGIPVTINFTGLTNSTQYYIYYVANNMDISINGLYSTISNQTVSTNTPGSSFGSVIRISMMVLGLIMLALFGMI